MIIYLLGHVTMLLKVTKQYSRGADIPVAHFADINDAKLFIQAKLADDARLKIKVTYKLFEGLDLLEEFSETTEAGSSFASSTQRSGGTPSPFNIAPRPPGMPPAWAKSDEDKKS